MSILGNLKKAIETCMPDLRHYYRITKKARVVNTYESNGQYYCDVQPLRNDESVDEKEPVVPKVTLPVIWGANNRGIVCPPSVGVLCDLSYYDGDPNYPFISNIRWDSKNIAPKAKLNEFIIQLENGCSIHIDEKKQIITLSPSNYIVDVGENAKITAGNNIHITAQKNVQVQAENASITAKSSITITAPQINQNGNVSSTGLGGTTGTIVENANREQKGNIVLNGNITVSGNLSVAGNSQAGSRSGGVCPHKC